MLCILYVLWYTENEPNIYGPFTSDDLAMLFFELERDRKDREPKNAIIYEQSCPARKLLVGTFRYVEGEWK